MFSKGKSFTVPGFRVFWKEITLDSPMPVQLLITIPKRNIKKAVDRNRMKRLLREAYRRKKEEFFKTLRSGNKQYALAIVFTEHTLINYQQVEGTIFLILQRLIKEHVKAVG